MPSSADDNRCDGGIESIGSQDARCAVLLFSRIPIPGKTKTRLHSILSPEECAALHEAMALDLAEKLAALGNPLVLCYSDEWRGLAGGEEARDAFIERMRKAAAGAESFAAIPQKGGNLGDRMTNAMQEAFRRGAGGCILMGTDLPNVIADDIKLAESALSTSDVVFGPSIDGGYWLIGLRTPFQKVFEGKHYGTGSVLTEAVAVCRAYGLKVALLREAFDVDVPEDYYQLCNYVNEGDVRLGERTIDAVHNLMGVTAADRGSS